MNVLKDIVKIVNQIRGKENIFGYKSTTANQFYLVYCFLGEIYFSPKYHKHTKLFCFLWQFLGILIGIFQLISYLLYGDKKDVAGLLYTAFSFMIIFLVYIIVPYISVIRYRKNIHEVIQMADRLIMKRKSSIHKPSNELSLKKLLYYLSVFYGFTGLIFGLICNLNLVLFYEKEKVQNYSYYLVYVPKLDLYGSLPFFLIFNAIAGMAAIFVFTCALMMAFICIFYTVIFHNEVQQIVADLNLMSSNTLTMKTYKHIESEFKNTIIKCAKNYQNAIKMVECFRGFYETLAALVLPAALYLEITHAFLFVSPRISSIVRLRELSVFLTSILVVYALCWAGEVLNESAAALSFAVYSTPWYWSTSLRKDVYILLCQTQRPITAKTLGAYPLCLATFLRFMNIIQSAVNVLRKITS
ncbi:odorant receptor 4-like [Planococcus citri]|uniref:odorant receptor 4-like n=1 Tax=Planococcus citri TaxID=170843 RepID=UPI0031F8957A